MTAPVLADRPGLLALNWSPRVSEQGRAEWEGRLRAEGLAPLGIYDVDRDGRNGRPAARRPEYFPVQYSEPLRRNQAVIGLDPYGREAHTAGMEAAARSGQPWSTRPFQPVQVAADDPAVAIFQPLYRPDLPQDSDEARRRALRGFLMVVLRLGETLEAAHRQGDHRRPGPAAGGCRRRRPGARLPSMR